MMLVGTVPTGTGILGAAGWANLGWRRCAFCCTYQEPDKTRRARGGQGNTVQGLEGGRGGGA